MRRDYSRLAEVEEKKSIRSAVIFGGLTLLIILLLIVLGLSGFSKFVNLFAGKPTTSQTNQTILTPPTLSSLPQYTNQKSIIVKGSATPNSTIKIFFNNSSDVTVSDDTGNFALNVGLTKGSNIIYAKTTNNAGNQSDKSNQFTVNYVTQTPNLTVSSPQNNQTFYGDGQKTLSIQGVTDSGNTVTVNDRVAILDINNKFNLSYELSQGDNQLKIISTDQAGNKKEIDLKVTFNP